MTLETAHRIVKEQGEYANKEAMAVVRGGMTICELTADGHRTYPWIKILPTTTDTDSSIEQALKIRRVMKTASSMKIHPKQEPISNSIDTPKPVLTQVPDNEKSLVECRSFSIRSFVSNIKQRLCELWQILDEIVVE